MKRVSAALSIFLLADVAHGQELLDRLDEALTLSTPGHQVRARLSGLLDLEGYEFSQPAPALITSDHHALFNPRLSLFLDAQLGPKLSFFGQARLDRGFDPSDDPAEVRLDEYALRFTPWEDGRFNVQIGKFATIVGTWVHRHLSWDNPFVTGPLPYENVTSVSDTEVAGNLEEFVNGSIEKYDRNPLIWGADYGTGASVAGRIEKFEAAAEIKNSPLGSRPESWKLTQLGFDRPTLSTHLAYRPNPAWNFGLSASDGAYLRPETSGSLASGKQLGDYHQTVLGQDISFAWHHWQLWAEFYEGRWDVPFAGHADTFTYYLESKYKITPQLFAALRWNQQFYSTLHDAAGGGLRWAHDVWRSDAALGYRFTAHTQLKLQYSLQHEASLESTYGHILAAQFTLRF